MEVIVKENYEEMSKLAAQLIAELVRKKPNCVLGLATGSTPIGTYKELIRMHKEEKLNFSRVVTFNLDEYVGLPPTHDQSYRYFMNENLFNHINIKIKNTHVPDGMAKNPEAHCKQYERAIKQAGGIDLQLLGIGANGHIGFNEPLSSYASRTRIVKLDEKTRTDNARFFGGDITKVPQYAITMGIATIMEARQIILLANGEGKADAIAKTVEGPITQMCPASYLQMHPNVIVIVDKAAASKLTRQYPSELEQITFAIAEPTKPKAKARKTKK